MMIPPLDSLIWLQGSAEDVQGDSADDLSLRLCLLVQPNCPGCHRLALPAIHQLHKEEEDEQAEAVGESSGNSGQACLRYKCYVISTAFEDFEYNNLESAQKLLSEEQTLVGAARQALGPSAAPYYAKLLLPFAHDIVVSKEQASPEIQNTALDAIKEQVRRELQANRVPSTEIVMIQSQVDARVLPEKIAHVFYAVRAQGTPTWILHRPNSTRVLDQRVGPLSKEELLDWMTEVQQQEWQKQQGGEEKTQITC